MALIVALVTSFTNLILGYLVLRKNPKSATHKIFFSLTITLAYWATTNYLSVSQSTESATLFWIRVVMTATAAMFPSIYLLSYNFPFKNLLIKTRWLYFIIIETFILQILSMTPHIFTSVTITGSTISPTPGMLMPLYALHTLAYLFLTIKQLFLKRRQLSGTQKQQLNMMLIGITLTFTLATITSFILVIIFKITNLVAYGPAYTMIMAGFIAYAIIRHKFLDISFIIFRTVSFAILTAIIIAIYAIGLFTVLRLIPSGLYTTASILLALILVYSYNPLRSIIEKLTKSIFYRQPYSSEKLLEKLGSIIRSNITISNLTKKVLQQLNQTMLVSSATFVITTENNGVITHNNTDSKIPPLSDNTLHNITQAVSNDILVFDDLEESPTKMLLRNNQISIAIPLKVKSTHHGLLLLEAKSSGETYSQQDLAVLEILLPQLSIAIQNAKSYDEIKHFADTLKVEVDKATRELKQANRHLKHLDKLKDEFVFIATHELKNPVTAMRGYLSMLKEGAFGPIPEKMQDPVGQLQASNQQLVDLVNDLLQIARSEAKTLTVTTTKVELCPLIDAVIGNVKPLYEQKGLRVTHTCPNRKLAVTADETKLKEIINNLVSNAIKYSDKGTITVSHEITDHQVTTHVQDQGVGIPSKDQNHIFTRFYRVEEEVAKGIPGTGLGLFIVKQLVEKMGGRIWFTSTMGIGTTFSFSLPLA